LTDILWYVWQCWRHMRKLRPQVVHSLLTAVYLTLPALLLMPRIRRVMSAYSDQCESYRDRRIGGISIGAAIKRFAMQRSQVIEALSDSIRADLLHRGLPADKVVVAPCSFTDLSRCTPTWPKERWVLFVGRFVEIKQPLLLIEAVPKVIAHHSDVHFYFLGEGGLQPQMEARLQQLGVTDAVTIRFDPQPTQLLNRSGIFVSLQTEENYPSQSLLEAMACGNAIVATNVGETWRLVDETNGLCVQPEGNQVADALLTLLADPTLEKRQQMSRQRVLADYTPERFFGYMQDVYRRAASA
jgi:glycosyltransferase involved in cell wall biosynthesis